MHYLCLGFSHHTAWRECQPWVLCFHVFVVGSLSPSARRVWTYGCHVVGRRSYLHHCQGPVYREGLLSQYDYCQMCHLVLRFTEYASCDLCSHYDVTCLDDVSFNTFLIMMISMQQLMLFDYSFILCLLLACQLSFTYIVACLVVMSLLRQHR